MSSGPHPVKPSYHGLVQTTRDALILFSACHEGNLPFVERRPTDRDRPNLICSGNVFIYCESRSNIKRWTDGVYWSPSRIMSNFLIYREIDKRFGDDKTKAKTAKPAHRRRSNSPPRSQDSISMTRERERSLVGSLVDSYDFKPGGLVKKTISVSYGKTKYHLVSYYTVSDGLQGRLQLPSSDPQFMCQTINQQFIDGSQWRIELDEHGNELARDGTSYRNSPPQSSYHSGYDGHDDSGHGHHHDSYSIQPELRTNYHSSQSDAYPYPGNHHDQYDRYARSIDQGEYHSMGHVSHGTQMAPYGISQEPERSYMTDNGRSYRNHTSYHAVTSQSRVFPDTITIDNSTPRSHNVPQFSAGTLYATESLPMLPMPVVSVPRYGHLPISRQINYPQANHHQSPEETLDEIAQGGPTQQYRQQ